MRGAYLNKPKLVSEKIDELLADVIALDPITATSGYPETLFTKKPKQYQEYYRMACPNNNFYDAYYEKIASASPQKSKNNQPRARTFPLMPLPDDIIAQQKAKKAQISGPSKSEAAKPNQKQQKKAKK